MAHRKVRFGDSEWDVWDVRPEARAHSLGSDLRDGWLCFQCGTERRRLAPIPDSWETLQDGELQPLFERAYAVAPIERAGQLGAADAFRAIKVVRDQEAVN